MSNQPRTGKRVQIYLPADLLEQWEHTPRYERSKEIARALRKYWGVDQDTDQDTIGRDDSE